MVRSTNSNFASKWVNGKYLLFIILFLGVLAALAIHDNETKTVIEIWWDGTTSQNLKLDIVKPNHEIKHFSTTKNGEKTKSVTAAKKKTNL